MNELNQQVSMQRNPALSALDTDYKLPDFKTAKETYYYVVQFVDRYFSSKETSVDVMKKNRRRINFANKLKRFTFPNLSHEIIHGMSQMQSVVDIDKTVEQWKEMIKNVFRVIHKSENQVETDLGDDEISATLQDIFRQYAQHEEKYSNKLDELISRRTQQVEKILTIDDVVELMHKEGNAELLKRLADRVKQEEELHKRLNPNAPNPVPIQIPPEVVPAQTKIGWKINAKSSKKLIGAEEGVTPMVTGEPAPMQTVEFVSLTAPNAPASSTGAQQSTSAGSLPPARNPEQVFDETKARMASGTAQQNAENLVKYYGDLMKLNVDLANATFRALRFPPLIYNVEEVVFNGDWENFFQTQFFDMKRDLKTSDSYDKHSTLPMNYVFFVEPPYNDENTVEEIQSLFVGYILGNSKAERILDDPAAYTARSRTTPAIINGAKRNRIDALLDFIQDVDTQGILDLDERLRMQADIRRNRQRLNGT